MVAALPRMREGGHRACTVAAPVVRARSAGGGQTGQVFRWAETSPEIETDGPGLVGAGREAPATTVAVSTPSPAAHAVQVPGRGCPELPPSQPGSHG